MIQRLTGQKLLVLVSNGAEEAAISSIQRELLREGASVKVVGTEPGLVNSWNGNAWGLYFPVDIQISQALGADFDLLVVPGGARSIQKLSTNPHAERIISSFVAAKKPMCFMGDAAGLLVKLNISAQPQILTGDVTDMTAFIQSMIAHFVGAAPAQMAA